MATTESKFDVALQFRVRLVWETEQPYEHKDRRSPYFIFKNCEWYLKLILDTNSPASFDLYMVTTAKKKKFSPFHVKTSYRSKGGSKDLFCKREVVSDTAKFISRVNFSDMENEMPRFKFNRIFTIYCVLDDADNSIKLPRSEEQVMFLPLNDASLLSNFECSSLTTWDQFFSFENLSKDLNFLLDNKILPDIQLIVGETSIPCHRAVLSARSKVFAAMFEHKMVESNSGVLAIKDIDLCTVEIFLKYLYSGRIPDDLSEDILVKLYKTGDKYEVTALKRVSSRKIKKFMNKENCLSYFSLAEAHSDQEFKDAVACYIAKEDTLIKSLDWIQFSKENPMLALEVYHKYVGKEDISEIG